MDTWVLIFILQFAKPMPPVVIQGFESEKACQETADRLHQADARLAPMVVSVCVPARVITK